MRGLNEAFVEYVQSAPVEGEYGALWLAEAPDQGDLVSAAEEYPVWTYQGMTTAEGKDGFRNSGDGPAITIEDNPFVVSLFSINGMELSTDLDILRRHFELLRTSEWRGTFSQDYFRLITVTVVGLTPPHRHPKKKDADGKPVYEGDIRVRLQTQRTIGEF